MRRYGYLDLVVLHLLPLKSSATPHPLLPSATKKSQSFHPLAAGQFISYSPRWFLNNDGEKIEQGGSEGEGGEEKRAMENMRKQKELQTVKKLARA